MCLFERLNILKVYDKRVKQPEESFHLFCLKLQNIIFQKAPQCTFWGLNVNGRFIHENL
jgi:hypothetical protein